MGCKVKELRFGLHKCRTPGRKLKKYMNSVSKHIIAWHISTLGQMETAE